MSDCEEGATTTTHRCYKTGISTLETFALLRTRFRVEVELDLLLAALAAAVAVELKFHG